MVETVTNSQIMSVLLEVKEKLGSIQATSDSHAAIMARHMQDDVMMARDISVMQQKMARFSGAIRVWGIVGTAVGGALGTAASLLFWHK